MSKKENHRKVQLIKKFKAYEDKVVYTGTLKGALKRIPESKKNQFEIVYLD